MCRLQLRKAEDKSGKSLEFVSALGAQPLRSDSPTGYATDFGCHAAKTRGRSFCRRHASGSEFRVRPLRTLAVWADEKMRDP